VCVVWTALLGATIAMKRKRHLKLELFLNYCPQKYQALSYVLVSFSGVIITGVLFAASLQFVKNEVSIFGIRGWLSIIFPIFFSLTCFRYLTDILENLQKVFTRE
jgi:TRAP-type C4-dicarboxylate transport system permease small subunit